MEYDFKALSDYDFELLCQDLLGQMLAEVLEGFRRGRDRGIDLRYTSNQAGTCVVQCKHYANTPFSGLRNVVEQEKEKVSQLQPERYILATSRFLTPLEKDTLYQILSPYCKSTGDILGGSELNALLRQYPQVEQAHYKLWLTSSAVMEKILQSDIFQRSEFLQEDISQKLKLYVQSENAYGKAMELLKQHHCCIISGIPGIGKTTLAEILMVYYLDKGYQIIKVRSDIQEALQIYQAGRRQVFLYDDFLGSTSLAMKQNKNEGEELLTFLSRISRLKGKRLILTTREYILRQAQQEHEAFARQNFDYNKCVISLEDYTRVDRAHILYNHLYFYQVPQAWVEDLLESRRVLHLIDHPNYNPRLIESVIKLFQTQKQEEFYAFFKETLDHPEQLWEITFRRRLSPAGRDLVLLMSTLCYSKIGELQLYYAPYHRRKAKEENRMLSSGDFMDALKETEGTFIKVNHGWVSYHNPSIKDFVGDYLRKNEEEFTVLCEEALAFKQCVGLGDVMGKWDCPLCRPLKETFLKTVQRLITEQLDITLFMNEDCSPGKRIEQLQFLSKNLAFPELGEVASALAQTLPYRLAQEEKLLDEEHWDELDTPKVLRELIDAICIFDEEGGSEFAHIYANAIKYIQKWFSFAYTYEIDDFLALEGIGWYRKVSIGDLDFAKVHEALGDFTECIFPDSVEEIQYEYEGRAYLSKIQTLESVFGKDLSDLKDLVNGRLTELEEDEWGLDDENEERSDRSNEAADILDMFESLRGRELKGPVK